MKRKAGLRALPSFVCLADSKGVHPYPTNQVKMDYLPFLPTIIITAITTIAATTIPITNAQLNGVVALAGAGEDDSAAATVATLDGERDGGGCTGIG